MITRIAASIFILLLSCTVFVNAANDDGTETKDETIERLQNELEAAKEAGKEKDETIKEKALSIQPPIQVIGY